MIGEEDDNNIEVWPSGSQYEEKLKPTYGAMFMKMTRSFVVVDGQEYRLGEILNGILKTVLIQVLEVQDVHVFLGRAHRSSGKCDWQYFLVSLNISSYHCDDILNEVQDTFSTLRESISWN